MNLRTNFALVMGLLGLTACEEGGLAEGSCQAVQIPSCSSDFTDACPECPDNDAFCVAIDGNEDNDRCCGCGVPFSE
ncbi:MAG: hypothetical protein AAGA48_00400 [Myxococcota bacterium]